MAFGLQELTFKNIFLFRLILLWPGNKSTACLRSPPGKCRNCRNAATALQGMPRGRGLSWGRCG